MHGKQFFLMKSPWCINVVSLTPNRLVRMLIRRPCHVLEVIFVISGKCSLFLR